MNVLVVGSGAGSWQMRGEQLGGAIGARVSADPTDADWHWAELVVLVKRAGVKYASRAHALGLPIVWDALDFWQQPSENRFVEQGARILLQRVAEAIQPTLVIGATEAQAATVAFDGLRATCLPHHGRLGVSPAPPRETCQVVAYDGSQRYLGRWETALRLACARRGWTFDPQCSDLRRADIVVALRDGVWDGWMCREWKSGVKYANAVLAGRPVITQYTAAWRELATPGSSVLDGPVDHLDYCLDYWAEQKNRQAAYETCLARWQDFALPAQAARFAAILSGVRATA